MTELGHYKASASTGRASVIGAKRTQYPMAAGLKRGTGQMLKIDKASIEKIEKQYPGISETVEYYERLPIPVCPSCNSNDTAKVTVGLVGRTINLAAVTTKVKLLPNSSPSAKGYFCNSCGKSFS